MPTCHRRIYSEAVSQPRDSTQVALQTQARHTRSRVRTGCRVCKIRRIKCDETKPACKRCTTTGRKCEGYGDLVSQSQRLVLGPSSSRGETLSLASPFFDISGNLAERRSFHYLRIRAIYDISGYFECDFWNRLVLQMSHTEPAVRHALLALSSFCEVYDTQQAHQQDLSGDQERLNQFALQQYNKAIGLLAKDLAAQQSRLEVTLASCLVFIWLEFLRNDFDSALVHLESGLKILYDFYQPGVISERLNSPMQHIDISLIRLFTRLDTQATIHGSPTSDFNSRIADRRLKVSSAIPSSFPSIDGARKCLDGLLSSIIHLLRQLHNPDFVRSTMEDHPSPDPCSLEAMRELHLRNLQLWQTAVESSTPSAFQRQDPNQTSAFALLNLYHGIATIILSTLFTRSQMVYDDYNSDFDHLLTIAESVIHNFHATSSAVFLDMGIMLPLYFIVLKCRDLRIRRKAIALLKLAPSREGMWHRTHTVQYAEWKVAIEERGRGDLPDTAPLPESARVFSEKMEEVVVQGRKAALVRFRRQRGDTNLEEDVEWEEDLTDMGITMAQVV